MTSEETNPQPAPHSRFGNRPHWFVAELLVIIAGVLIALAIDEWRSNREEAQLELRYLAQLISDLQLTEQQIAEASARSAASENAGQRLLAAFEDSNPTSVQDAGQWLSEMRRFSSPVPVLGTMQALISTGDLRLLNSAEARSGITGYLSSTQNRIDRQERYEDLSRELYIRILLLAQSSGITPSHRAGMARGNSEEDAAAFFSNPEAYALVERFVANKTQMATHRDAMLAEATELRKLLAVQN